MKLQAFGSAALPDQIRERCSGMRMCVQKSCFDVIEAIKYVIHSFKIDLIYLLCDSNCRSISSPSAIHCISKCMCVCMFKWITYDAYVNGYDIVDQRYQHSLPYCSHVRINRVVGKVVHDYFVDPSGYSLCIVTCVFKQKIVEILVNWAKY